MNLDEQLVSQFYEAAFIPDLWPAALKGLGAAVDSFGQAIVSIDRFGQTRFLTTSEYEPAYRQFAEAGPRYHNVRPERAIARRHFGFIPDVELCTPAELEADPIYWECLRPNGVMWTVGAVIPSPSSDLAFFDLCRGMGSEPFDRADVGVLDAYRPHLSRSALLSTRIGLQRARDAVSTLGLLALPAAALTHGGRVLAANDELVALGRRIPIGANDRLSVASPGVTARVLALLEASRRDAGSSAASIPVPATAVDPALILHIIPVRRQARDIFSMTSHLLLVTPVTTPDAPLTSLMEGLFDLTPAEARLARRISQGNSLQVIALETSVSVETLRTQLKAVLRKTGTRRQVDLALLLAAISPPAKRREGR